MLQDSSVDVSHLQRKHRLLVINPNEDLSHDQLLPVITEEELRPEALVTLALQTHTHR